MAALAGATFLTPGIGGGLLGGIGAGVGAGLITNAFTGGGDIKGKTATDRRINQQYQTLVKDLRLAGLNPSLAYGSANAATSATGTAFQAASTSSGYNSDLGSAVSYGLSKAQQSLLQSQEINVRENTAKTAAERGIVEANLPRARTEGKVWAEAEGTVDRLKDAGAAPTNLWDTFKDFISNRQPTNAEQPTIIKGKAPEIRNQQRDRRPTKFKKGQRRGPRRKP